MDSPWSGTELQGTSPVLSGVTCVGGQGRSQTQCLPRAHRWGHNQTGVYLIFPSPRGRTHCGVVWPLSGLLAHFQAYGAASMGSSQGCIRLGGSTRCTGVGGAGLARFAVGGLLWEGSLFRGTPVYTWLQRVCSSLLAVFWVI